MNPFCVVSILNALNLMTESGSKLLTIKPANVNLPIFKNLADSILFYNFQLYRHGLSIPSVVCTFINKSNFVKHGILYVILIDLNFITIV